MTRRICEIKPQTVVLPGQLRIEFRQDAMAAGATVVLTQGQRIWQVRFSAAGDVQRIEEKGLTLATEESKV